MRTGGRLNLLSTWGMHEMKKANGINPSVSACFSACAPGVCVGWHNLAATEPRQTAGAAFSLASREACAV